MAIRTHDGLFVRTVQVGLNPVYRVWAGRHLIWTRPDGPHITSFSVAAQAGGVVLRWGVQSTSAVTAQQVVRVAPNGVRLTLPNVQTYTREFVNPLPPVGRTTYELHVTTVDGTTSRSAVFERDAAPTASLSFTGFTSGIGAGRTARFAWTIQPGYPIPHVTLQHVSGPGQVDTRAGDIENRLRRGLTTGTITVTRGGGAGGSTTLQLTATNSSGSQAATASSGAW